jgi:hypothetical protein
MKRHDRTEDRHSYDDEFVQLLILEKERAEFWEREWPIITVTVLGLMLLSSYLFGRFQPSLGLLFSIVAVIAIGWRLHVQERSRAKAVRHSLDAVWRARHADDGAGAGAPPAFYNY